VFDIVIVTVDGAVACQLSTETSGQPIRLGPGPGTLTFSCDELGLLPGIYNADVSIKHRGAPESIHWQYAATMLRVDPGKFARGTFFQATRCRLESESPVPRITPLNASTVRPMRSVGRG
jgi:hypothetical protein